MKLYYKSGSCSLAVHIALNEAGLSFSKESVDLSTKITETGKNFYSINPKGSVPALALEHGDMLTEVSVLLQYISDLAPEKNLLPPPGSMARLHAQEMLNFISTELHKNHFPLFYPSIAKQLSEEARSAFHDVLAQKFSIVAKILEKQNYVLEHYSMVDIYLFVVLSWGKYIGFNVHQWPSLSNFITRIGERPAVFKTLEDEGLLETAS